MNMYRKRLKKFQYDIKIANQWNREHPGVNKFYRHYSYRSSMLGQWHHSWSHVYTMLRTGCVPAVANRMCSYSHSFPPIRTAKWAIGSSESALRSNSVFFFSQTMLSHSTNDPKAQEVMYKQYDLCLLFKPCTGSYDSSSQETKHSALKSSSHSITRWSATSKKKRKHHRVKWQTRKHDNSVVRALFY